MSKLQPSWRAFFEKEVAARYRLDRLMLDGSRPDGKTLRSWWKSVEDLLLAYAIAIARGERPEPPPAELAEKLSNLAGYLAVGQIPGPIEDAKTEGRRAPGPTERQHIGWAVAYRRACRPEGFSHNGQTIRIEDKTPIKTLAAWFELDPNTIRGWVRDHCADFLGVNDVHAEIIVKRTRLAGARYSRSGRGIRAIKRRQRKG